VPLGQSRRSPNTNGTNTSKGIFADIRDHRKRCDGLLLHPTLAPRLEHRKKTLDDCVEVRQKNLPLDTLADVDER